MQRINPKVKVIAASGLGDHPNLDSVRDLGVEHFLSKPFRAETILQKLEEILAEESNLPALPLGHSRTE
jgi:YesN/AraC family two-component response regulator